MWRKSGIVLSISLFLIMFQLMGCTQEPAPEPYFIIETHSTQCKSDEATPSEIKAEGDTIIIMEVFQTPDPCREVKGDVLIEGREINVLLQTEDTGDMCIQCIAEVIGKVTVSNLSKGSYNLHIQTPDREETTSIEIDY